MQIAGPSTSEVFFRQKTWLKYQILYGDKELRIVVGNILKKMPDQVTERFFHFCVLLPAMTAISLLYNGPAVQTVVLMSQMLFHRRAKYFLNYTSDQQKSRLFQRSRLLFTTGNASYAFPLKYYINNQSLYYLPMPGRE
jgi:hypothetical protein